MANVPREIHVCVRNLLGKAFLIRCPITTTFAQFKQLVSTGLNMGPNIRIIILGNELTEDKYENEKSTFHTINCLHVVPLKGCGMS
jgi:hypothetical protein